MSSSGTVPEGHPQKREKGAGTGQPGGHSNKQAAGGTRDSVNPKKIQGNQNLPQASASSRQTTNASSHLALFDHLPKRPINTQSDSIEDDLGLHPSTVQLGTLFRNGTIRDDDDRVAALLATFCAIIQVSYVTIANFIFEYLLLRTIQLLQIRA